ncbi:MAG: T9SS type A sorting domain-containing protein [Bacteroidales bacterium]|nr:T9SS type A sorting domain-containing protein [Bacteroidales bacterium]
MKKLIIRFHIIIIIFFTSHNICIGQAYHPFPDSNAVWSVLHFTSVQQNDLQYYTIHYGLFGDTIIDSMAYSKIFSNELDTVILQNSPNTYYHGALRQDIVFKKIYFVPKDSINEILLYDFDLNINDTIYLQNVNGYSILFECWGIDSATMDNNQIRSAYNMTDNVWPFTYWQWWIEGIGNNKGLFFHFYPLAPPAQWNQILCFWQNDSLIYRIDKIPTSNPYWDTIYFHGCYHNNIITNLSPSIENVKINISPNPVTDISYVTLPDFFLNNKIFIEIYSCQGKLISSKESLYDKEICINKSNYKPGIYLLLIHDENKVITIKFIIQ